MRYNLSLSCEVSGGGGVFVWAGEDDLTWQCNVMYVVLALLRHQVTVCHQHATCIASPLIVRLKLWVLLKEAEVRGSRQMDCASAAAPFPWEDTAHWCAGYVSGRAAGRPGWTGWATEPSHTTGTPGQKTKSSSQSQIVYVCGRIEKNNSM